jgi:hypothetical protein
MKLFWIVYLAIGLIVASFQTDSILFGMALAIIWPAVLVFWAVVVMGVVLAAALLFLVAMKMAEGNSLLDIKNDITFELHRLRREAKEEWKKERR